MNQEFHHLDIVLINDELNLAYHDLSTDLDDNNETSKISDDNQMKSSVKPCIVNEIASKYFNKINLIKKIDLTETNIKNLSCLNSFMNLESLVLDKNSLISIDTSPKLLNLKILCLNNNHIVDLPKLLDDVVIKFPKLEFLSLMRNPCTGLLDIVNPDVESYKLYRLYVLYRLPRLRTLDWGDITIEVSCYFAVLSE